VEGRDRVRVEKKKEEREKNERIKKLK